MTLHRASCHQIVRQVQSRESSARSIVDAFLSRADELQGKYCSFIQLTPELARKQADRVDAIIGMGRKLPLAGVPFAVKDVIDVRGTMTTAGSQLFHQRLPEQDATIVKKMIAVGAVCMGKLNMYECAYGRSGANPYFGTCINPWNDSFTSGGSSSGSALAVALDICPVTVGTDTGGSIRFPAAMCGVLGLKPTYGRISRAGMIPFAWSLDHVGPITRRAEDCALILRVLAGSDPADPSCGKQSPVDYADEISKPIEGLRIGVPRNWFFDDLDEEIAQSVFTGIEQFVKLGATRVDCEIPHLDEMRGAHRAILLAESATFHRPHLQSQPEKYSANVRRLLQAGLFISASDYLQAQRVRRFVREQWSKCFQQFDVLVTPTFNRLAVDQPSDAVKDAPQASATNELSPKNGNSSTSPLNSRSVLDTLWPLNLTGYPALSTPCGVTQSGIPIGMQLCARPYDEAALLRAAHHFQLQTDWHVRRPP